MFFECSAALEGLPEKVDDIFFVVVLGNVVDVDVEATGVFLTLHYNQSFWEGGWWYILKGRVGVMVG